MMVMMTLIDRHIPSQCFIHTNIHKTRLISVLQIGQQLDMSAGTVTETRMSAGNELLQSVVR